MGKLSSVFFKATGIALIIIAPALIFFLSKSFSFSKSQILEKLLMVGLAVIISSVIGYFYSKYYPDSE